LRFREILTATLLLLTPSAALAHPHVWVDAASEIVFDDKGRVAAIRHHWLFDEGFSAYALQGLDADRDGKYSTEELKPLAQENVESLKDFDYFTFLAVGDYQAGYAAPRDYYLELAGDRLLLHFTLPLAMPLLTRGTMRIEVGDPEYYVAFTLPNAEAVRLVDAPAACRLTVHPARALDPSAAAALATIGPEQRDLPPELQALAAGTENSADVTCGAPADAAAATAAMADQSGGGDLTALPAAAEATAQPAAPQPAAAQPAPPPRGGIFRSWTAWIVELQTTFNRDLTAGLKNLKSGGGFLWLGSLSFLYGIVHAAGPGHGKVVISSYLVANEARVRRGVAVAFVAAFVQAVVAVAIIGLMAVILNMTSMAITSTAKVFEAGSFALVAALGLYLTARKGRAAWDAIRGGDPHAHHDHHGHEHHAHPTPNPSPQGGGAFAGAAAAILSVGMRPCSGALVVLVFALSQGIFWAGVASTFVMALGTAITVAALAALAVGAKGIARRLARGDDRRGSQVVLGVELAAALAITLLGAVLFFGSVMA
jgi:ABC-type nickel/cobalt efflux system permease component RcnA/ABC-type uncharacterized transport system substrate-binding protein